VAITRRRLDFLKIIKQEYESTGLPVHYVRVAELMGISKWSAYEMLKTLEKEGFVSSQYEVNHGEKYPGRAMVLFVPSGQSDVALAGTPVEELLGEWSQIKERLLSFCEDVKKGNSKEMMKELVAELAGIGNPMISSAYVITILISQLQTLSDRSVGLIKKLVADTVSPESGLAMFAGAIVGSMPKITSRVQPVSLLLNYLSGFQKNLAVLNRAEQAMLMEFLGNALAKTV